MEERLSSRQFRDFARTFARRSGHPATFLIACAVVAAWAVTGPIFHYSDTWQLVINTATTSVTFLMVFLIQNTQTRDSDAIQIKLDEVIRSINGAHNALLNLEELDEDELQRLRVTYLALAVRSLRLPQSCCASKVAKPLFERTFPDPTGGS